uniref:Uncharacterized protein n=1 Tax=mine drainage metagenome TaxID=410659 RepID=E6QXE3_9ZZZZ
MFANIHAPTLVLTQGSDKRDLSIPNLASVGSHAELICMWPMSSEPFLLTCRARGLPPDSTLDIARSREAGTR